VMMVSARGQRGGFVVFRPARAFVEEIRM